MICKFFSYAGRRETWLGSTHFTCNSHKPYMYNNFGKKRVNVCFKIPMHSPIFNLFNGFNDNLMFMHKILCHNILKSVIINVQYSMCVSTYHHTILSCVVNTCVCVHCCKVCFSFCRIETHFIDLSLI